MIGGISMCGLWEEIQSGERDPHEWDSCPYKRASTFSTMWSHKHEPWDLDEGPHPMMLAPWFCTFSLQHSENYIMNIYKTPRLRYFVRADLTVWGTGHFSLKALYTFIFRGESVYPLPQNYFEGTKSFRSLYQTCHPFLIRLLGLTFLLGPNH